LPDGKIAASKAAKTGVVAETQYDLARAEAKRDYNNTHSPGFGDESSCDARRRVASAVERVKNARSGCEAS